MILFICNSRPPFGKMHRPGAFITKNTVCFSIYDNMQGFLGDSGLFIYLFFFAFYAEIQNGHPKGKSPVDSADNLRIKNFIEIALSRSVSEINTFFCFTQKYKMVTKSGRKK